MNELRTETFFQKRNVLITGATGFIGSHLTRRLVESDAHVSILTRSSSKTHRIDDVLNHLNIYEGDMEDSASLFQAIQSANPDIIYHLAFCTAVRASHAPIENVQKSLTTNVEGSINLLLAALEHKKGVQKFIRSGGLEEYGDGPHPYREGQREKPVSPYSASQVALTHYSQMLQQMTPMELINLRLALVYGPAQSESFFIPSLIQHCLQNKTFTMTKGSQRRDYLYIDDAIDGLIRAATVENLHGELINIASGHAPSMKEVATQIRAITECTADLITEKPSQRYTDIEHLVADNAHANALLGWQPRWDMEIGLRDTVEWFRTKTPE